MNLPNERPIKLQLVAAHIHGETRKRCSSKVELVYNTLYNCAAGQTRVIQVTCYAVLFVFLRASINKQRVNRQAARKPQHGEVKHLRLRRQIVKRSLMFVS